MEISSLEILEIITSLRLKEIVLKEALREVELQEVLGDTKTRLEQVTLLRKKLKDELTAMNKE